MKELPICHLMNDNKVKEDVKPLNHGAKTFPWETETGEGYYMESHYIAYYMEPISDGKDTLVSRWRSAHCFITDKLSGRTTGVKPH